MTPPQDDGRPPLTARILALIAALGLSGAVLGFLGWASTLD